MTKDYSYLSVEECLNEFTYMCQSDKAKLIMNCRDICYYYDLAMDENDLLNEMLSKIISGERNIPRNEKFLMSISWVCKSIAESIFRSKANKQRDSEVDEFDTVIETKFSSSSLDLCNDAEMNKIKRIFDFFSKDIDVTTLLHAIYDELKPREIIAERFNGDRKLYDAARKRLSRAVPKLKMEVA